MADADDSIELLFFDTFSHEIHEVILNLCGSRWMRINANCISRKLLTGIQCSFQFYFVLHFSFFAAART